MAFSRPLGREIRSSRSASVRLSDFGTDLLALRKAVNAAYLTSGCRLIIDVASVAAGITTIYDPIRLYSGLTLEYQGGSITWDKFGLPLFWGREVESITIIDPVTYFSGVAGTTLPAVSQSFYDTLGRSTKTFPARDVMGAFCFFGAKNIEWQNPKFRATDFSDSAHLMQRTIVVSDYDDGSTSKNIRILGEVELDGTTMGPLLWGVDGGTFGNVTTKRRGQLDVNTYPWEVAGHAIYVSAASQNYNITAGKCVDEGTVVPGTYMANDPASFKFRRIHKGAVESIDSHWPSGALEWCTTGVAGQEFTFGPIVWHGRDNVDMASAGPINMPTLLGSAAGISGEASYTNFSTMNLYCPADMNDYVITNDVSIGSAGDTISHVNFGAVTMHYAGTAQGATQPLFGGSMSDCTLTLVLDAPSWNADAPRIINIDNGGSRNTFDLTLPAQIYDDANIREGNVSSVGNSAVFRKAGTAETRDWGPTT